MAPRAVLSRDAHSAPTPGTGRRAQSQRECRGHCALAGECHARSRGAARCTARQCPKNFQHPGARAHASFSPRHDFTRARAGGACRGVGRAQDRDGECAWHDVCRGGRGCVLQPGGACAQQSARNRARAVLGPRHVWKIAPGAGQG